MQHYYVSEQFGGKEAFHKQLVRDKQLRLFVKSNNFHLLEIKYNLKEDAIKNLIKNFLYVPANYAEKSGELLGTPTGTISSEATEAQ